MTSFAPEGFLFPYVRFFNAVDHNSKFDFYICNTLAAAGIPFGAFSSYLKISGGQQIFKVTKAGDKNNVIAQICIKFHIGKVCTICAKETSNGITLCELEEYTNKDNLQYGHIRICNLSSQCRDVSVYANNECIAAEIGHGQICRYLAMIPGKYTLKVKCSDEHSDFLTIPSIVIKPGKYNTLYIIGAKKESSEPVGVFTVDAASYSGFYL